MPLREQLCLCQTLSTVYMKSVLDERWCRHDNGGVSCHKKLYPNTDVLEYTVACVRLIMREFEGW